MTLDRAATSDHLTKLRGIADQVHSIAAMVEQGQYCIEVRNRTRQPAGRYSPWLWLSWTSTSTPACTTAHKRATVSGRSQSRKPLTRSPGSFAADRCRSSCWNCISD